MSIPQSGGGAIESKAQLAAYMESGSKPKSDWTIGTEHEKFGFDALHRPLPYEGDISIKSMLEGLRDGFGWSEMREAGKLIGLTKAGANISLEPGGQFELSGAMVTNLHQSAAELQQHLHELHQIGDKIGAKFMGLGAAPEWRGDEVAVMPKGRYRLMTDYMGRVGTHGTQMMYRTCTVQVNLDYSSESDMVKKLRVALSLQPVATALFANSPFFDGKPNGHKSWRSRIWRDLDAARTGMLPFAFESGMGFEAYVDWVLDVPMYFVYRNGKYINALGQSFRDFLNGELPALPGEVPSMSDWADHMTTVFPEARVKKYIEMRGADVGNQAHINALPAFWVGLMYNSAALDAAWDLVKGFDEATREALRVAASVDGLDALVDGVAMIDLAHAAVALSHTGLAERGLGEEAFLAPLMQNIATKSTQADRFLAFYHGAWKCDLRPIYQAAEL